MEILGGGPDHVRYAFGKAGYDEYPNDELAIEAFIGGLEIEAFARALKEGRMMREL